MAKTQYLLEKIVVDTTVYAGLANVNLSHGVQSTIDAGGSELDPSLAAVTHVDPVVEFDTLDLATWLPALFSGHKIPHLPIGTSAQLYLQATAAGGTRGGAGTNIKMNVTKGVFVPTALFSRGGITGLRMRLYLDWDGTNNPVTFSVSQNLAAGSAGAPSLWAARAIKIASTTIARLGDITLDFGITVGRAAPANALYAMASTLTRQAPQMGWETHDIATALAASGASALASGSGGIQLYLGQYDDDAPGVLSSGAMAIVLRAGSVYWPSTLQIDPGATPLRIRYTAVGQGGDAFATDPPMTLSTGLALPSEAASAAHYRPGRIVLDGTAVEFVRAGVDFGVNVQTHGPAALPWPNYTTVVRREPTVTLQSADADFMAGTLGLAGVDIASSFLVYLRKQTDGGEAVADGSGVHVSLLAGNGRVEPSGLGGGHAEFQRGDVVVKVLGGLAIATTATSA